MAVAQPYPNLLVEVRLELVRAGLKRDDVVCRGRRFGREWIALEGARHAPYQCKIGGRTLSIAGRQTYFDANGHRLKPDDPQLPRRAARVVEAGLTWQWR